MHYLGIYITSDCKNLFDVSEWITKLYGSVPAMAAHIGNNNELVALEISEKQCLPVLFYGLNAICITNNFRNTVSKAWNFGIKKVFNLNYRESIRHLLYYCDLMSVIFNIDCLQLTLYTNLCKSSNPVRLACCLAMHNDVSFKSICNMTTTCIDRTLMHAVYRPRPMKILTDFRFISTYLE